LRRSVSPSCTSIGLLKALHEDNFEFFLQNVGKIYAAGLPIRAQCLFQGPGDLPLSRSTPPLSPAIGWDHSQSWMVIGLQHQALSLGGAKPASASVTVDAYNKESEVDCTQSCLAHHPSYSIESFQDISMLDHVIDGRVLYPFAGHVVLAWKMYCKLHGLDYLKTPVVIENMNVFRATILSVQPSHSKLHFCNRSATKHVCF